MTIFSILFQFVMKTVAKYNIDESHGLSHAFQILLKLVRFKTTENPQI